jgi:hypothetical protein
MHEAACKALTLTLAEHGTGWHLHAEESYTWDLHDAADARYVIYKQGWFSERPDELMLLPQLAELVAHSARQITVEPGTALVVVAESHRNLIKLAIEELAMVMPIPTVITFEMSDAALSRVLFGPPHGVVRCPAEELDENSTFEDFKNRWSDVAVVDDIEHFQRLFVCRTSAHAHELARAEVNLDGTSYDDIRVGIVGPVGVSRERFEQLKRLAFVDYW